jgi:two-component system, chemotaxis family, chemotaxis protein CheY
MPARNNVLPTVEVAVDRAGRILVVEDDPEILDALCDLLSEHGYNVVRGRNGHEALRQLESQRPPPDLILLDLTMPVMDGHEFLDRRNRSTPLRRIPVLVISALAKVDLVGRGVEFLSKPIDVDRLLETVARLVSTASTEGAAPEPAAHRQEVRGVS